MENINQKELEKKCKEYGFYQYRSMAKKFLSHCKNGKSYATIQRPTNNAENKGAPTYDVYSLIDKKISHEIRIKKTWGRPYAYLKPMIIEIEKKLEAKIV